MQKDVRNVAKMAANIILENKNEYQKKVSKNYHEGDELLENILLTNQLQFSEEKVLPLLIYNFMVNKRYLYVCVTNMYERFSEFFRTTDVSDQQLTATIFYLAKIYVEACNGEVLDTKIYTYNGVDFYKTYFESRSYSFLFEDFKCFLSGEVHLVKTEKLEQIINHGGLKEYNSKNIAILSYRIFKIVSKKASDISLQELEDLVKMLIMCGLTVPQAQRIVVLLKDKKFEIFNRRFELMEQAAQEYVLRNKKQEQERTQDVPKKVIETKLSKYISDKEYKNLLKEVKKYYNPYTRELINEFISSEERERIAAIMVRLGLENYQVVDFLKKTEKVAKTYTYEYFKNHVEEFEFYFGESLPQVHEYMKEMEVCTEEEDKEYWIVGINEELAKLNNSCKLDSYEYESQLLNQRKLGSNE